MKSSQKAGADVPETGAEKPAEARGGLTTRKRKRRLGFSCDRTCGTCRVPCDNPFYPGLKKKS